MGDPFGELCSADSPFYEQWLQHHKSILSRAIHSLHVLSKQWPEDRDCSLGVSGELSKIRDRITEEMETMSQEPLFPDLSHAILTDDAAWDQYKKEHCVCALKGRTIGAVAYPAVLATFGTVVVVFLLIFFVPRFDTIFATMRQRGELPLPTEWLLAFSRFLLRWSFWIAAIVALAAVAGWRWLTTEKGRTWRDLTKLRLPVAGVIFRNLAIARFCRVLGTMLSHGVPILHALRISSESAGNRGHGGFITDNYTEFVVLFLPV